MALIERVKLVMEDGEVIDLKEIRWAMMMNDLLEIYNFNASNALMGSRMTSLLMNELDIEFMNYQECLDWVVENYALLEPMKEERFLIYIKDNFTLDK